MKKTLAALAAALMMLGLFGVASATADPGPNGNNEKGLCTAYFNGQKKGHDKDGDGDTDKAKPFIGLEEDADDGNPDNDGDGTGDEDLAPEQAVYSDVFEFCNSMVQIMGNPEENGRYDCREDETRNGTPRDTDGDGQLECVPNGTEG